MKMFYEKDANVNLIKDKKSSNIWIWKSGTCSCIKFKRQWS